MSIKTKIVGFVILFLISVALYARAFYHPRAIANRLIGLNLKDVVSESPGLLRLCDDCSYLKANGEVFWVQPATAIGLTYREELQHFVVVRDGKVVATDVQKP
jgi:hypothetical protein